MQTVVYPLTDRGLQPVNPLNVGYEYCLPSHSFGPTVRRIVLLHYIVSGKGIFEHNGVCRTLSKGMCFVIRPEEVTFYKADAENPWHYIWLGFNTSMPLPRILACEDFFAAKEYADIFLDVEKEYPRLCGEAGDFGVREAYLCGKITELLARLQIAQCDECKNKIESSVMIARNYIDAQYASDITVASIAEQLHHERTYFSRMFRKAVGSSPQAYLLQKRMSEAARLLTQCGFTPTQTANAVGYPDIFSFSKMFKRYFGVSPRAFRDKRT